MPSTPLPTRAWRAVPVRAATALLRAGVAATLLGIMGLTVVNVFMRYALARPISGADEIVQFLLALLVFSAFPLVTVERRHFSVSVLARSARGSWKRWSVLLELAVSALGCWVVSSQLFAQGRLAAEERMSTMVLQLPMAPLDDALGLLAALAVVGIVVLLLEQLLGIARGSRS